MVKAPASWTRRHRVLGLPIGRRETDWGRARRAGMVGLGAASAVAGGVRAAWTVAERFRDNQRAEGDGRGAESEPGQQSSE